VLASSTFLRSFSFSHFASLAAEVVFAGALQSRQQDHDRRLRPQVQRPHALAHQRDQLVVDDADQRLAGRQALVELLPDDLGTHRIDERLDHRQRDVRLEQRHAHLAQACLQYSRRSVARGRAGFDDALQALGHLSNMGAGNGWR
jgi:hypothetical protein